MKRYLILLCLFLSAGLSAQTTNDSLCEAAINKRMEAYKPVTEHRWETDTVFSFYYYKDNVVYDFCLVNGPGIVTTLKTTQGGKLITVETKYVKEALALKKQYKAWKESLLYENGQRKDIKWKVADEKQNSRPCDGMAVVKEKSNNITTAIYYSPNTIHETPHASDSISNILFNHIISFSKKIQ